MRKTCVEMWRARNSEGYISGRVQVNLDDIIEGSLDDFCDLLSEKLTGYSILEDISYEVVGHEEGNTIVIEVTGDPSGIFESECIEGVCICDHYLVEEDYDLGICPACGIRAERKS